MTTLNPDKCLTRAEMTAILESVPTHCITKLQHRVMLETLFRAGLRTCEITNLKASQVEWPTDENHHRCALHLTMTKGGFPRMVPVPDVLHVWLARWRDDDAIWQVEHDVQPVYFFHQMKQSCTRPYTTAALRKALVPICEKATGRHVNLHMLRHTYATNFVEDGIPLPGVQRLLGHQRVGTTMVYVDVRGAALAEQVRGMV